MEYRFSGGVPAVPAMQRADWPYMFYAGQPPTLQAAASMVATFSGNAAGTVIDAPSAQVRMRGSGGISVSVGNNPAQPPDQMLVTHVVCVLTFVGVFAAVGLANGGQLGGDIGTVAGVAVGEMFWRRFGK